MKTDRVIPALLLGLLALLACLVPDSALAQQPSARVQASHDAFDAKVLEQLAALEPDMREQWIAANQARETADDATAIARYTEVIEAHPEFDHALRRRCSVYAAGSQWKAAVADCKAAHRLRPSPENIAGLAAILA
ncbi:MAG: hypothetical protein HC927_12275, partial [Deltaproteobacteria bacterium]|nr:hypothetical protein [Deltaproteobacteria bacterium]